MKNHNEVVLNPGIKVTGGTIRLGNENIQTKTGFILKSPEYLCAKYGSPAEYHSFYSRKKSFRRRG